MLLTELPYELLLHIASDLSSPRYLLSLIRCNILLHNLLTPYLHKLAINLDKEGQTFLLHQAIKSRNVPLIESILRSFPQGINHRDGDGRAPLHYAIELCVNSNNPTTIKAYDEYKRIIKLLLENNPDVNLRIKTDETYDPESDNTFYGETALQMSVSCNEQEIAYWLLENGADIKNRNDRGETILHVAVNCCQEYIVPHATHCRKIPDIALISRLLDSGIGINEENTWTGETALHIASFKGHTALVKLLLERGADPKKTTRGATAYDLAVRGRHTELIRLLQGQGIGSFFCLVSSLLSLSVGNDKEMGEWE